MKILHVGLDKTLGGIERFLFNVYNNRDKSFQMDFVTTADRFNYVLSDFLTNDNDCQIIRIANFSNPLRHVLDLYRCIQLGKYDIVHIHKNSLANPLAILVASVAGSCKVIVHSHNTQPSTSRQIGMALHWLNKRLLSKLPVMRLACSRLAGDWLFHHSNYTVLHNAIDLDKFIFDINIRKEVRTSLDLEDCFVIGAIARISDQKNQLFMLDILQEVLRTEERAMLVLVGGYPRSKEGERYYQLVLDKIKRMHLDRNVRLLGSRDDANQLYQAFDVALIPSKYEGLSIAAIEAQAAGLPCVVSDVLSDETRVSSYYTSVALSADPANWAEAILQQKYVKRSNMKKEMEAAGYAMKQEIHSLEEIYSNLVKTCD